MAVDTLHSILLTDTLKNINLIFPDSLRVIFPDSVHVFQTEKIQDILFWGLTKSQVITIFTGAFVSLFIFFSTIFNGKYSESLKAYREIKERKLFIINWLKVVVDEATLEINEIEKYTEKLKLKITSKINLIAHYSISTEELLELKHFDLHKIFILRSKQKIKNLKVQYFLFSSLKEIGSIYKTSKEEEEKFIKKLMDDQSKIDDLVSEIKDLIVSDDYKVQGEFKRKYIDLFQKVDESLYEYDEAKKTLEEMDHLVSEYAYKDNAKREVLGDSMNLRFKIIMRIIDLRHYQNDQRKFFINLKLMLEYQVKNLILIHNYLEAIKITFWWSFEPFLIFKPLTYKKFTLKKFDDEATKISQEFSQKKIKLEEEELIKNGENKSD